MGIERGETAGRGLESLRFDDGDTLWMRHRGWLMASRTQDAVNAVDIETAFRVFRP